MDTNGVQHIKQCWFKKFLSFTFYLCIKGCISTGSRSEPEGGRRPHSGEFYQKVSNKETVDIDIAFVIQAGFSLVHLFSESKRPLSRNFSKGPSRKDF